MTAANGCARYEFAVVERQSGAEVGNLSGPGVATFSRVLQATSTTKVVVPLDDCKPGDVTPWVHSIRVNRFDGATSEGDPWVGPIVNRLDDPAAGTVTLIAADRSVWWQRALPELVRPVDANIDQAVAFAAVVRQAERAQPSGLTIPAATPVGVRTVGGWEQFTPTGPLFEFEFGSVPWTVNARVVEGLTGPVRSAPVTLDTARSWHASPVIETDGTATASQVVLVGFDLNGDPARGVYPPTPLVDETVGYHKRRYETTRVWRNQAAADADAKAVWEADRDGHTFIVTSGATLTADAPVTIWDLIPGTEYTLLAGTDSGLFRLYNVAVQADWDGHDWVETRVAPDFQPVGTAAQSEQRRSL